MNNPFARPPQTEVSAAAQRFPDVLHTDPDLQQQQQYGYGQGQMYPQQTGGFGGAGMNGYAQGQGGSTGYGGQQQGMMQHLQTQQTGYGGGYAGGSGGMYSPGGGAGNGIQQQQQYGYTQQQQLQYTGMNSYQQPVYSPAPPVADLDPYASLSSSSFASPSPAPGQQQQQQQQPGGSLLAVPQTQSHPRDYVQESRAQLMAWDDYAWRQLDNRIDALREAWQTRIALLRAASDQGADPVKTEQLRKESEGFVDSIHAAKMQLAEVKSGWRHSTDAASKSRVREALNAGLSSLPPYPTPLPPSALGGSFALSATKQHILSQYGQPQPQQAQMTGMGGMRYYGGGGGGGGMMQPRQTGYGGGMMQPQQTGYGGGMMMPQQTGYGGGYGGYGGAQGGYY